jgi:hypothetical protein
MWPQDFTYKSCIIFSNCGGRCEHFWGISCEKSRFYAKKIIFFPILGGGRPWCGECQQGFQSKTLFKSHVLLHIEVLPPQLEKIWFFDVKSWCFTRNIPNIFAPPFTRRNCFKCAPPYLKSWIRPCTCISGHLMIPYRVRSMTLFIDSNF